MNANRRGYRNHNEDEDIPPMPYTIDSPKVES